MVPFRLIGAAACLIALLVLPGAARAGQRTVDLGSAQRVAQVAVAWDGATPAYRVRTSLDGARFRTVARVRRGGGATVRLPRTLARYVRVGTGRGRPPAVRVRAAAARRPTRPAPAPRPTAPPTPAPSATPSPTTAPPSPSAPPTAAPSPGPSPTPTPLPSPVTTDALAPPALPESLPAAYAAGPLPAPLANPAGARRYVSTTGADANPGTIDRPWRSITKALTAARPGELVLVRGGTYAGVAGAGPDAGSVGPSVYASPQGTAAAPIAIQPYPGEQATIAAFVSLPSARWFRLSGFTITGAGAGAGAQGVSLGNTSGAEPSHVELSYNAIRDFGPVDDHAQGILHYSGSDTALIGNRIHHIGRQTFYDHAIYLKAGRRVVVANNVISDITGGYGLHVWGDLDDSWILNNTVYNSAASGFTIGGNSDRGLPDRVVTANNILAGHAGAGDGHQGYAAKEYQPGAGNSTRHNLGWANARSSPWQLSLAGPADNRTTDPRFADVGRRDLAPAAGSPAIDAAEAFGLRLDANLRGRDDAPDLGAYEVG